MALSDRKLEVVFDLLESLKTLSYCKRAATAAIIIPDDFSRIDAIGYNGPPSGLSNDACTGQIGRCGCVHAEANALLKIRSWDEDLIMVCLTSPCPRCAGLIINSKVIRHVICCRDYRLSEGAELIKAAGIRYDIL